MNASATIAVITGLISERRCLERADIAAECAGPGAACAGALARRALQNGATGLVSFGLAGALAADLQAGAVVLADAVMAPDGARFAADEPAVAELRETLGPDIHVGSIAGVADPVATARDKRALAASTGAIAVDMESHAIAAAAAAAGRPFVALRAVADPASRGVPPSALAGLGPHGETHPFAVIGALLRRPADLPDLLRLAGDNRRAMAALGRVALRVPPGFGLGM